jgi:hypothetical protein
MEPAQARWSVRSSGDGWAMDGGGPELEPPPLTTIAWRLCHLAVENIGTRANAFFGTDSHRDGLTMRDQRYASPVPATARLPSPCWSTPISDGATASHPWTTTP